MMKPDPIFECIIVDCHLGHWTAWFENTPQVAYGGATPGEAVDRLHAAHFERIEAKTGKRI